MKRSGTLELLTFSIFAEGQTKEFFVFMAILSRRRSALLNLLAGVLLIVSYVNRLKNPDFWSVRNRWSIGDGTGYESLLMTYFSGYVYYYTIQGNFADR